MRAPRMDGWMDTKCDYGLELYCKAAIVTGPFILVPFPFHVSSIIIIIIIVSILLSGLDTGTPYNVIHSNGWLKVRYFKSKATERWRVRII